MARRLKLRISRVIPSFQSCRSKDPSNLPENPVPVFFRSSLADHSEAIRPDFPGTPPPSKPGHCSFKRHVSSAITSVGYCGLGSRSSRQCFSDDDDREPPEFKWKKEDKWHVVAKVYDDIPRQKIYNSSVSGESDDDVLPPRPPPAAEKKKRRSRKKKAAFRVRLSTSSVDSGLFSSDCGEEKDGEETETLVSSSRSFSTDSSSEFNPHLETIREIPMNGPGHKKTKNAKKAKKAKRGVPKSGKQGESPRKAKASGQSSPESESVPARLSMFQRLIPCTVDGKVRESFAVVKKSEDPYEDFKRSMMEMILEKQMFEEKDLEQLLHCLLSLNSRHHHGVIVEAFTEIWNVLFCKPPTHKRVSRAL